MTLRLTSGDDRLDLNYIMSCKVHAQEPVDYTVQSVLIEVTSPNALGDTASISLNMSDVKRLSRILQNIINKDEARAEQWGSQL